MSFRWLKWLVHPVVVFVGLQIVWVAITLMWVFWFVDEMNAVTHMTPSLDYTTREGRTALGMLVGGTVLLLFLSAGTVALFVRALRQGRLMQQQQTFLSSVTHELRSPLASLKLMIETLKNRNVGPVDSNRLLTMGENDIERLLRLVSQILVASRLDRGIAGFAEDREAMVLTLAIRNVVARCQWLDKDIDSRVNLNCSDPHGAEIRISKTLLHLVLVNLLENAIKYSPKGSPIEIMISREQEKVVVAVSDHGIGLERDDIKRIFRMFYRSPVTTKKAISGTGLGLFIVRTAMRFMGGRVWVVSPGRDQGCTFFVSFPKK